MRDDYYKQSLAAERLRRVYEIAPRRVRRYLNAEVEYVRSKLQPDSLVLELGCGYGRILPDIAGDARLVVGIDNSTESLRLGLEYLKGRSDCLLAGMNALALAFRENRFDLLFCIQNGISAFHVDRRSLIAEAIRVVKPGGTILFSSYSEKFWEERLNWFQLQADAGLLGEIDYEKTGIGVIVCKDGFSATTVDERGFLDLVRGLDVTAEAVEVDESSLFLELTKRTSNTGSEI